MNSYNILTISITYEHSSDISRPAFESAGVKASVFVSLLFPRTCTSAYFGYTYKFGIREAGLITLRTPYGRVIGNVAAESRLRARNALPREDRFAERI